MKWTRPFDPDAELVWVGGRLVGRGRKSCSLVLALDTGTANTLIDPRVAKAVGLDKSLAIGYGRVRGVAGPAVRGPRIVAPAIEVLGRTLTDFVITCLPLSDDETVDGVLGLDFVRKTRLTLDFEVGLITLQDSTPD